LHDDAERRVLVAWRDESASPHREALERAYIRYRETTRVWPSKRPRWYARTDECATDLDPIAVVPTIREGYAYGVLSDGGVIRARLPCL
jgi:hypothetical protein